MPVDDTGLQQRLEALFCEELEDNLRVLEQGLVALEQRGAEEQLLQRLFRAAHSLKGAAHSAGITDAVRPCHRLEGVLVALRDRQRAADPAACAEIAAQISALTAVAEALQSPESAVVAHGLGGAAEQVSPSSPRPEGRARVTVARLDRLLDGAGALVAVSAELHELAQELDGSSGRPVGRDLAAPAAPTGAVEPARRAAALDRRLSTVATELRDTARALRLQPFREVTDGFHRVVRQLCHITGKEARVVVAGGEVEIDRDIGDALRDPLLHLVRNAVDHGIEAPDRRTAAEKASCGTVTVSASHQGEQVVVRVQDDGAGVDVGGLRARAGGHHEDDELPFVPGLSTASELSDVSGRGMGLDAARAAVEGMGGALRLRSEPGRGTAVEVVVPRSLAVMRVVVVDAHHGQVVALPLTALGRLERLREDQIEHVEDGLAVIVAGRRRPAVRLATALESPAAGSDMGETIAMTVAGEEGALLVSRVLTEVDVVLRPLPRLVPDHPAVLGAALVPTGEVALVANPVAALRHGLAMPAVQPPMPPKQGAPLRVLLAEDTLTTRALERSILEGAGYEVVVASDGAEALDRFRTTAVDVVVTDIDMPRMDGIELCRAIRASPLRGDVPVVLVTSLASEDDRRRGLQAGANAYLVKSAFDQTALLDAVGRFL